MARGEDRSLHLRRGGVKAYRDGEVATAQANGKPAENAVSPLRAAIARQFNHAEDVVYVGLAFLLAVSAGALLVTTGIELWKSILGGTLSFRAHALVPEPFLIAGLIAVTRRILVVSAEFSGLLEQGPQR